MKLYDRDKKLIPKSRDKIVSAMEVFGFKILEEREDGIKFRLEPEHETYKDISSEFFWGLGSEFRHGPHPNVTGIEVAFAYPNKPAQILTRIMKHSFRAGIEDNKMMVSDMFKNLISKDYHI